MRMGGTSKIFLNLLKNLWNTLKLLKKIKLVDLLLYLIKTILR